jgi:hypothetical protein
VNPQTIRVLNLGVVYNNVGFKVMFDKCAEERCHTPSKTVPDDSDSVRLDGQNSEDINMFMK